MSSGGKRSLASVASFVLNSRRSKSAIAGAVARAAGSVQWLPKIVASRSLASGAPLRPPTRLESSGLHAVFEPRSVAVIGATEREGSVGRTIVNNLIASQKGSGPGYAIFPVNPTRDSVLGLPCFKSLEDIPVEVDMVVFVTPAKSCLEIMRQCAGKRVKAAVVISAGFKEAGPEGAQLELDLIAMARGAGIRVVGPNCVGVMNPNFGLNATFAATSGLPGKIAFISQSGAMCTAVLDWSLREHIGFSAFVSVGSMSDVHWGNLLDYLGSDSQTEAILIYMEAIGDAGAFLGAAKEVCRKKPVVVIKAGKSEAAAQAAASHTGSLAGSYASFEAAMHRVGVLPVDTIQDLFDCALVLGKQGRPRGPNLMIVTNAGGPAVLATDATVTSGAALATLQPATLDRLNAICPAAWSHANPVDILGDAPPSLYAQTLDIVLQDESADGVLVVLSPQDVTDPTQTARELLKAVEEARRRGLNKPVLAAWMGGQTVEAGARLLSQHGVPTFSTPDSAATTFGRLWQQVAAAEKLFQPPPAVEGPAAETALLPLAPQRRAECIDLITRAVAAGRNLLTEAESKAVLAAYGLPCVPTVVATTPDQAVQAASEIAAGRMDAKFAVKLNSETLTHKADVGGVRLNLSLEQVRDAVVDMEAAVTASHGSHHFQGVTVQPMLKLEKGIELILGSTVDAQFGPLVMFGSGGTMVEVYKDTALALPTLDSSLAEMVMQQTRIFKALRGGHGKRFEGVNLPELRRILIRFSMMVADLNQYISECDINPLLATRDGFTVLDARFALRDLATAATVPSIAIRPYPGSYIYNYALPNEYHVTVRPSHAGDYSRITDYYRDAASAISADSSLLKNLSPAEVSKADYDRAITLICAEGDVTSSNRILAIARLERPPPDHLQRQTAYAGITVLPQASAQTSDLRKALLDSLSRTAAAEGVEELRTVVDTPDATATLVEAGWTASAAGSGFYSKALKQ